MQNLTSSNDSSQLRPRGADPTRRYSRARKPKPALPFNFSEAVTLAKQLLRALPSVKPVVDELYGKFPMTKWNAVTAIACALLERDVLSTEGEK
jgi:hypothetical protein